jgi:hypothetical protein
MRSRFLIREFCRAAFCGLLAVAVAASAQTAPEASRAQAPKKRAAHPANHPSAPKHQVAGRPTPKAPHKSKHPRGKTKNKSKKRGQQAIDSERARQIQEALIREHYLSGQPSGTWDSATQAAMQRYQADQGWQSKTTPDSRALIRLGLGPSPEHLLNPESAMTSSVMPASAKADSKPGSPDAPASPSSKTPSADTPQP